METEPRGPGGAKVIATARASGGRRILGVTMLSLLGLLLINVAFSTAPGLWFQLFLLVMGAGAIWLSYAIWCATQSQIELTEEELRDSDGTLIARIDDIEVIDRGFFAFKPSNGFLLRTKTPGPNRWRPGLWWRIGRRIGVGGMTPARHSKAMSEIMAAQQAMREMGVEAPRDL